MVLRQRRKPCPSRGILGAFVLKAHVLFKHLLPGRVLSYKMQMQTVPFTELRSFMSVDCTLLMQFQLILQSYITLVPLTVLHVSADFLIHS